MKRFIEWIFSLIPAFLLLQTLYYKFSGSEESVYIFTAVGMEPWGRYLTGIAELVAGVLLLVPLLRVYGAIIAIMVISGAIFFHLTILGIEVMGDSGRLFFYALAVFISCWVIVWFRKKELPIIGSKF